MPTICELKIAIKEKGLKGITGLNKGDLEILLKTGKAPIKKTPKIKQEEPVKEVKKEEPVKEAKKVKVKKGEMVGEIKEEIPKFGNKPPEELYKIIKSLKKQIKDEKNKAESERSVKFLKLYEKGYDYALKNYKKELTNKSKSSLKRMINAIVKRRANTDENKDVVEGLGILMNLLYDELDKK